MAERKTPKAMKVLGIGCLASFGLCCFWPIAYYKLREDRAWGTNCDRLETCRVYHVPHRIRLFEKTKELPKEGWGYLYNPVMGTLETVTFRTDGIMMASSDLAKLKDDVQAGKLVFYRADVRRVSHYLDPKDLRDEDLVELESTRPEPIFIPLSRFQNGSWRYFKGKLVSETRFTNDWPYHIEWWNEPPPRIGEPMPQ